MEKERGKRIKGEHFDLISYPSAIKVDRKKLAKDGYSPIGIMTLIPNIEIVIGGQFNQFIEALENGRIPLAINLSMKNGDIEYHSIIRLATGKVVEAKLADICVYKGIIVGIAYNKQILGSKEFRKYVALGVLHQIAIHEDEKHNKLHQASYYISLITQIPREELIVEETKKNLRVKAKYKNPYTVPLYYTFTQFKQEYRISQVGFDLQAIGKELNRAKK